MMLIIRQSDSFIKTFLEHCGISYSKFLRMFFKVSSKDEVADCTETKYLLIVFLSFMGYCSNNGSVRQQRGPLLLVDKKESCRQQKGQQFFVSGDCSKNVIMTFQSVDPLKFHMPMIRSHPSYWIGCLFFSQVETTRSKNWEKTVIESSPVTEVVEPFIVMSFFKGSGTSILKA